MGRCNPSCDGIVVIHRDLTLVCTHEPCPVAESVGYGTDGWLMAHVSIFSCDFVLKAQCPRCVPTSGERVLRRVHLGGTQDSPAEPDDDLHGAVARRDAVG